MLANYVHRRALFANARGPYVAFIARREKEKQIERHINRGRETHLYKHMEFGIHRSWLTAPSCTNVPRAWHEFVSQMTMFLSSEPVAASGMTSQKPTASIVSVCATSGASTLPVAELTNRAVLSSLPVIMSPGVEE